MKSFANLCLFIGLVFSHFSFGSVFVNKATVRLKVGTTARYFAAAKQFEILRETRKESGNIKYDLHYNVSKPNEVIFNEIWKSKEDLDSHLQAPHMSAFFQSINFNPSAYDILVNNGVVVFTPKKGNLNYVIEMLVLEGKSEL